MDASSSLPLAQGLLRQDLVDLLGRSERYALTLLLAPAGSGKSTLLEHWRVGCRHAVVHYGLQAADNQALSFFRGLGERIRQELGTFDTSWFNPWALCLPSSWAKGCWRPWRLLRSR